MLRKLYRLHHLTEHTVGKDNNRIAVFLGDIKAFINKIHALLNICRGKNRNPCITVVSASGDLEIVRLTWLNTSDQGMVFRSNADFAKFDRVEVDGATVAVTNYSVSEGSTIVELNAGYLKRLSLGRHIISIVAKDGKATTGFTIKQGASATGQSGGSGIWGMILLLAVIVAIAIPVTYGVYYYRKKTGGGGYSR